MTVVVVAFVSWLTFAAGLSAGRRLERRRQEQNQLHRYCKYELENERARRAEHTEPATR
jgi:hypothetical protein